MSTKHLLIFSFLLAISYQLLAGSAASAQALDQTLLNSLMNGFSGLQTSPQSTPASAIKAGDVFLSWSANTYAPFNYEGKSMPVYGSVISASIVPAKSSIFGLDKLIYRWYLDDDFQDYASNSNRQNFVFRVSQTGGFHAVKVEVLDKNGASLFLLEKNIAIVSPEAIIFPAEKNNSRAKISVSQAPALSPGEEQNFTAIPYFFSSASPGQLSYKWTFENQTMVKTAQKNQFNVRVATGELAESFTKELSVLMANPLDEMQRAVGKIGITIQK